MENIIIYLICLDQPIIRKNGVQVRHYIGSTDDLKRRISEHRNGKACHGSPLLDLANQKGIKWSVVRIWQAKNREKERWLKKQKKAARFCPYCNHELPF